MIFFVQLRVPSKRRRAGAVLLDEPPPIDDAAVLEPGRVASTRFAPSVARKLFPSAALVAMVAALISNALTEIGPVNVAPASFRPRSGVKGVCLRPSFGQEGVKSHDTAFFCVFTSKNSVFFCRLLVQLRVCSWIRSRRSAIPAPCQ